MKGLANEGFGHCRIWTLHKEGYSCEDETSSKNLVQSLVKDREKLMGAVYIVAQGRVT